MIQPLRWLRKVWRNTTSGIGSPLLSKKYSEANLGKEDYETLRKNSLLLNGEKSQYLIIADNDHTSAIGCSFLSHVEGYPKFSFSMVTKKGMPPA
jgi:hypothetical protein